MSPRLTNKYIIASLDADPAMAGLRAYRSGRRRFRDDGGHGTGGTGGGDDDAGSGDAGDEGDGSSSDEDDDTGDDDKDPKNKGKGKDDEDEDDETVPKWKYDKLHKRMQAADRTSSDLRTQLEELKNSKDINADVKRELDDIKTKVGAVESERDKLMETNKGLSIKLAALAMIGDGMPVWEDPDVALRLADLSDVDISDEGKVDKRALKSALKALAKEKPYLVKKAVKASDGDGNESGATGGTKMNGNRKGSTGTPDRTALASRFPVLGRQ